MSAVSAHTTHRFGNLAHRQVFDTPKRKIDNENTVRVKSESHENTGPFDNLSFDSWSACRVFDNHYGSE